MSNQEYSRYIITEPKPNRYDPNEGRPDGPPPGMQDHVMYLDAEYPKDAFYTECVWIWKANPGKVWARAHTHEWDEVINFFGTNPEDIRDLGGEIELWLEDEKFILTKSFTVFVPKGMKHCPVYIQRVDRPIFHFTAGMGGKYERELKISK